MYQKIIVPIDHGNRNMKTEHKVFTSGFVEGDCRPALGEYLHEYSNASEPPFYRLRAI